VLRGEKISLRESASEAERAPKLCQKALAGELAEHARAAYERVACSSTELEQFFKLLGRHRREAKVP